jgi:hypothetical protein
VYVSVVVEKAGNKAAHASLAFVSPKAINIMKCRVRFAY